MFNSLLHTFAHAGESHESSVESLVHTLDWYVEIALLIVAVAVFAGLAWLITKNAEKTVLSTAALLLVLGFVLAGAAPVASIVAISVGLMATLFVTLVGLGSGQKK